MLDIKYLMDNKDECIELLNKRNKDYSEMVNQVIDTYNQYKEVLKVNEDNQQIVNSNSKLIGNYKREGKDVSELLATIEEAKTKIDEEKAKSLFNQYQTLMYQIPNLPAKDIPLGVDDSDNVCVREWGDIPQFAFTPKSHDELGEMSGGFDFKRAVKIAKSRFVIARDEIARLERAISNFMLDSHTSRGYHEFSMPVVANEDTLYASGQLPKFANDLFKIASTNNQEDEFSSVSRDFYLIPTAEVCLANLYRDEIIDGSELNMKYCAYTQCFRKEAGSAGRDTKGIIRVHQFGKVELFKYTTPETSWEELDSMVSDAEYILQSLKLPYRVVRLCGGDIGFGAATTYDLEVWFPSQNTYRECSSCSNVLDFQARRGKIRYKDSEGNIKYPHMLNGSGMAVGRILAAVMENYQNEDGTITIPDVLVKYMER